MLSISTIPEALATLTATTGRQWVDSELFDLVTRQAIHLHAVVPATVATTIQEFVIAEGMVERMRLGRGHTLLAVLFPFQVARLWLSGETTTSHPEDYDEGSGEYKFLVEPIIVKRDAVRLKAETLRKIISVWRAAQTGAARAELFPEWMWPPEVKGTQYPVEDVDVGAKTKRSNDERWKVRARELAVLYISRHREQDLYPSQRDVSESVEKTLRADGVLGTNGKPVSAAYIQRNALQGDWWATHKP